MIDIENFTREDLKHITVYVSDRLYEMSKAIKPPYYAYCRRVTHRGIRVYVCKDVRDEDGWLIDRDLIVDWWEPFISCVPTDTSLERCCDEIWENIPAEYKERDWKQIQ